MKFHHSSRDKKITDKIHQRMRKNVILKPFSHNLETLQLKL